MKSQMDSEINEMKEGYWQVEKEFREANEADE